MTPELKYELEKFRQTAMHFYTRVLTLTAKPDAATVAALGEMHMVIGDHLDFLEAQLGKPVTGIVSAPVVEGGA